MTAIGADKQRICVCLIRNDGSSNSNTKMNRIREETGGHRGDEYETDTTVRVSLWLL